MRSSVALVMRSMKSMNFLMKSARKGGWFFGVFLVTIALVLSPPVLFAADDGPLFQRNLSDTPELHTEYAVMAVMPLYVPAQNTLDELVEIEFLTGDCTLQDTSGCTVVDTRTEAKPMVATYLDGDVAFIEGLNFTGHGQRDAFAAYSFDDGATWKTDNLSKSGDLSSFRLADRTDYPGDVFGISTAVVGNRVFVAWASRYCKHGNPLYSWEDDAKDDLLTAFPELSHQVNVDGETEPYELFTDDLFGVGGMQGSSDFARDGYPEIGEVPYACLWTARGTLEEDPDTGTNEIVWRQAERITSGVRDVNLVQAFGVGSVGFGVTWQEDPDGLRPGKALCPDGGFNGAIAHQGTDLWFTSIALDDFDEMVIEDEEKPVAVVPMAMPVRLTDSAMCKGVKQYDTDDALIDPYCYADFNQNGTADVCAETVSWTNPGGTTIETCQTEDGRVLTGRTAATRARIQANPFTDVDGVKGAWLVLVHEQNKAMGDVLVDPTDPDSDVLDIGKDIWYHTFSMFEPELVAQGMILNQPAVDYETGDFFAIYTDEWGNEYRETEIARRAVIILQGIGAAMASESKTSAMLLYSQGVLFQGGPADVMARRVVLPDDFDQAVDNPFAYENVRCGDFDDEGNFTVVDLFYDDGSNPNYVRGICPGPSANLSGTTIVECDDGSGGDDCADSFPWDDSEDESGYPKVTEWVQAPDNFNDQSWANPYDAAYSAGGYLDGDFLLVLYSMAPNWNASTTGQEAFNLYARRSFDGGQTWTTLPASFDHIDGLTYTGDGTDTCEDYGWGGQDEEETCTTYGPGEFEQARNLSRLTGSKVTVIDPSFTPTGGTLKKDYTNLLCYDETAADGAGDWENCEYTEAPYPDEIRDPGAFFVAYGTGDNSTLPESEPQPISMFYGRASNFGDDYDQQDVCDTTIEDPWYPVTGNQCEDGETDLRFDWLAYGKRVKPSDVSLIGNPAGDRLYAVWSQEDYDRRGNLIGIDARWRRVFYNLSEAE